MSILEEHLEELVHLEALWIQILRYYGFPNLCGVSEYFKALIFFQVQ